MNVILSCSVANMLLANVHHVPLELPRVCLEPRCYLAHSNMCGRLHTLLAAYVRACTHASRCTGTAIAERVTDVERVAALTLPCSRTVSIGTNLREAIVAGIRIFFDILSLSLVSVSRSVHI
jgi:hypothetical protein